MASPATGDAPNGITTPTNPNASGQAAANTSTPPSSSAAPGATTNNNATALNDGAAPTNNNALTAQPASQQPPQPAQPPTSISDSGLGKRPKDARLIHMVLAHQGVQAYQERVPLQLLDFAYRYTAGVLSDAVSINAETTAQVPTTGKGSAQSAPAAQQEGSVSLGAVRSAIASRLNYQFNPTLPKEFLLELGTEKNRVGLPKPEREYGVRLPPERYCFTGAGWNLKEEWESEIEDDGDDDGDVDMSGQQGGGDGVNGGERMEGVQEMGGQEGDDEDDQDEFEEVMGVGSGGGGGSGGDSQMMDA
ncbi:transcription initiation factor IID, 31kD subunit-domain-containing protein [Phyllosticta citribraziliensis]|uniref:Transcription initiation factor IID, 31kD subunit-domain-containing protein n=1 Tax=Phyllosticta citribraziliensis TaxID=989973 RepID=A0ABR1M1M8_9PEZI